MRIIEKITETFWVMHATYLTLRYSPVGEEFDKILIDGKKIDCNRSPDGPFFSIRLDWLSSSLPRNLYRVSSRKNDELFDDLRWKKIHSNDETPIDDYPEKWNGVIELTYYRYDDVDTSIAAFKNILDHAWLFGCEEDHKVSDNTLADLVLWLSCRPTLTEQDIDLMEEIVADYKKNIEDHWLYS